MLWGRDNQEPKEDYKFDRLKLSFERISKILSVQEEGLLTMEKRINKLEKRR